MMQMPIISTIHIIVLPFKMFQKIHSTPFKISKCISTTHSNLYFDGADRVTKQTILHTYLIVRFFLKLVQWHPNQITKLNRFGSRGSGYLVHIAMVTP